MRRILILKLFLLVVCCLLGQTRKIVTTTLQGDGYTYIQKFDEKINLITLHNSEYTYVGMPLVYKSTGKKPPFDLREKRVEDEDWSYDKAMAIVNGAFSMDQRLTVNSSKFFIGIYIDSTTGRIVDVAYDFLKRGAFSKIPLSVFREIEVKLKEQVYFTLTEAGKKVNYVYLGWMHEVK